MPGIASKIKQKIQENRIKNKQVSDRKKYLHQVETNARRQAEINEAQERGKRLAKQEYGNAPAPKSKGYGVKPRGPQIQVVDPMTQFLGPAFFGASKKTKPQVPTKTTRVTSGGKTITITEKAEQEQPQKPKPQYAEFPDVLGGFGNAYAPKQKGKFRKEPKPFDPFDI